MSEFTKEEYKTAVFILLILIGVGLLGMFILNIQSMGQIRKIIILENNLTTLNKTWTIVGEGETIKLDGCIDFELYVAVNESGECFRPINQMNNSQFKEIWNMCKQSVVVRCIQ